jgi:hypothetical protein
MTALTTGINTLKTPFADVTAASLDIVFETASGGADTFVCGGRDLLIIKNVTGNNTVTITSTANDKGRTEDLTTYAITGTDVAYWTGGMTNNKGWKQTNGTIIITASSTDVAWAVLRLPAGYP